MYETVPTNLVIAIGGGDGNIAASIAGGLPDGVGIVMLDTDNDTLSRRDGEAVTCLLQDEATEQEADLRRLIGGDVAKVFVISCLGGETGSSITPMAVRIAREMGRETTCVVTMPFGFEGKGCKAIASDALTAIRQYADNVTVIDNNKLLVKHPDLPFFTAFETIAAEAREYILKLLM